MYSNNTKSVVKKVSDFKNIQFLLTYVFGNFGLKK